MSCINEQKKLEGRNRGTLGIQQIHIVWEREDKESPEN